MFEGGDNRLADSVAATFSVQLRARSTKHHIVPNVYNPFGGPIKHAIKGAPGIAGIRADLHDGSLTLHQVMVLTAMNAACLACNKLATQP